MSGDASLSNALANFSAEHEAANIEYAQAIAQANGPADYVEAAFEYMDDHVEATGHLIDDLVKAIKDF